MKVLAPYLKVKLEKGQSQKGRSPYKVVLDTTDKLRKSPEDVLSEGEQRIVDQGRLGPIWIQANKNFKEGSEDLR